MHSKYPNSQTVQIRHLLDQFQWILTPGIVYLYCISLGGRSGVHVPNPLLKKPLCSAVQFSATNNLCKIYTFSINMCFLLSDQGFQAPLSPCDNCVTGPGRCELGLQCKVAVLTNGTVSQTIFAEESMTLNFVTEEKECFVNFSVTAIGGGGLGGGNGEGGGEADIKNMDQSCGHH